jgi:hypothetical protein
MDIILNTERLGPIVQLVRITFDGEVCHEYLDAPVAVSKLLTDSLNGDVNGYCRGWINWNLENINARNWDTSF